MMSFQPSNNQCSIYLQIGSMPLPFPGMDKSGAAVCEFYSRGSCARADTCSLRHIRGDKTVMNILSTLIVLCSTFLTGRFFAHDFVARFDADDIIFFFTLLQVVCKHWLRGLCKKGDGCEFLHEYDMTKMPECYFYSRFSKCQRVQCVLFTML